MFVSVVVLALTLYLCCLLLLCPWAKRGFWADGGLVRFLFLAGGVCLESLRGPKVVGFSSLEVATFSSAVMGGFSYTRQSDLCFLRPT